MRASEETPEQRLARWRKLRDHLRHKGLDEAPPDNLLLKPEPTTRPNVGLVAHYTEIDQESLGNSTAADLATVALAAVAVVFSFTTGMQGSLVLFLVLGAVLMRRITRLLDLMVARKDSLNLTPEELSMSLPGRNRHTQWGAVYSTSVDQRRKRVSRRWPWVGVRKEPCVRVELDDGVVAWLYVCADECEPLADLMTDFLLCARNGGRTRCAERASAPEAAS